MTTAERINKVLQVARRNAGFLETLRPLFRRRAEMVHTLTNLSLTIQDEEMAGYTGPDDTGKSPATKTLSSILTSGSGICRVNGCVSWADRREYIKDVRVVFGQWTQLWWGAPVIGSFGLPRDIYQVLQVQYRETPEEFIILPSLEEIVRTPACMLSLGQWMRCEIVASLLRSPSLLFPDEPATGSNAMSKLVIRDFIVTLNIRHKTTIFITTRNTQDIEALAKRVLLIGRGQLLLDETLEDLKFHRPSPNLTPGEMTTVLYRDYQT